MTYPAAEPSESEVLRVPDHDLGDLASALAKTMAEVRRHGILLDRLSTEPDPKPGKGHAHGDEEPASVFILAMDGSAYTTELAALSHWVHHLLLPVYGREISSTRPFCDRWPEHPEAVARLHALWLAWQQLTDTEAGLTGASTWHRDHLDPTLFQLRAPDGPFAACTTNANRPTHRLLATPAAVTAEGLA